MAGADPLARVPHVRGAPRSPGGEDAEKGYRAASLPAAGWIARGEQHGVGGLVLGVGVGWCVLGMERGERWEVQMRALGKCKCVN
jgi:hypothetical protein